MPDPGPLTPESPRSVVWRLLRAPYTGWVVAVAAILWFYGNPRTITTEKIEWRERTTTTTKYVESIRTEMKIVGGPGSKTTVYPDGHYVIEGPATIGFTTSKTASSEATTDAQKEGKSEKTVKPVPSKFSLGAGPVISLIHPLTDSKLLVDGAYTFGHLLFFDVGVGGILEAPLGTFVPNYAGVKVTFSW